MTRPARSSALHEDRKIARAVENFVGAYRAEPLQRVDWVKSGIPATTVQKIAGAMGVSNELLFDTLGLARATIARKVRNDRRLSPDESSRVLGLVRLVGLAESMVRESGAGPFDAAGWIAGWLRSPLPALAGACPASLMDTTEGQQVVANLLARLQSGAYA